MTTSFSAKRPTFDTFKNMFLLEVGQYFNPPGGINSFEPWVALGDASVREKIIDNFMCKLEKQFGFRPLLPEEQLKNHKGSLESVVIQIYHVFSTMCLVDHINEKVYKQRKNKLH